MLDIIEIAMEKGEETGFKKGRDEGRVQVSGCRREKVIMPTKNHSVNIVLEKELYLAISDLAKHEGTSTSIIMRDLVKEAVELREDQALTVIAQAREATFDQEKALFHEDVWG